MLADKIRACGLWNEGYCIQQDPEELAALVECMEKHAAYGDYLAIGIAAGGVERFISEQSIFEDFFVIDNGKHPDFPVWEKNKQSIIHHDNSCLVDEFIGDSHSPEARAFLDRWFAMFPRESSITCAGIDGDHSPQGVAQDWELVQPYLAPGALVWFHDIRVSDVGQTGARKLWARLKTEKEVLLETNGQFGIGVIRV